MSTRAFQRAADRILARLGEDAVLRGAVPCRVHIEHGVEVVGEHAETTIARSVATIGKAVTPKIGDTLVVAGQSYVIDSPPMQDNGFNARFLLRRSAG